MTTQHEAMRAALEALTCHETYFKHPAGDRAHKAIVMLRTALAATHDAQQSSGNTGELTLDDLSNCGCCRNWTHRQPQRSPPPA